MQILSINSGSSSVKFDWYEGSCDQLHKRISGKVDGIGEQSAVNALFLESGQKIHHNTKIPDHENAIKEVLSVLSQFLPGKNLYEVDRIGFRIVHGGELFFEPVHLTDVALSGLEHLGHPAPLHNPPALKSIRAAKKLFSPATLFIGVFDTEFHKHLSPVAYTYALPYRLMEKYKIRRYGFHGLAHQYMRDRYMDICGVRQEDVAIITAQLGSGCSVCAINNGQSVDTSMGFTPLEGLVMRTRTGDIDAGLVSYLARQERLDGFQMERMLNEQSGLAGLSGTDGDMRTLISRYQSDVYARLAIDIFCYKVAKYICSYIPVVGIPKAIVFGGGIGEMSPFIREKIWKNIQSLGITFDDTKNAQLINQEGIFSAHDSKIGMYVIPVDESYVIASRTCAYH